jgi:hypothetical protein
VLCSGALHALLLVSNAWVADFDVPLVSWLFAISIPTWRRQSAKRPSMQQGEGEGLFLSPWTQYCQGLRNHPSFRCVVF